LTLGRRRRVWPGDEGPEQFQLSAVASIRSGELQDSGNVAEALVVHQESEGVLPELPLSDVLVAVRVARQLAFRIVEMERADAGKSDGLVHGPEEGLIPFRGPELVTGGERVARVDTDCEAFRMRGPLDDFRELREAVADDGALAAVFSRTAATSGATAWSNAQSRLSAIVLRARPSPFPMCAPGWKITSRMPKTWARSSSSTKATRLYRNPFFVDELRLIK